MNLKMNESKNIKQYDNNKQSFTYRVAGPVSVESLFL